MDSDCRGDMGFGEALICLMAVITVLLAFMSAVTFLVVVDGTVDVSPLAGSVEVDIVDGEIVLAAGDALSSFISSTGARGVSVHAMVPGGFSEFDEIITEGHMDGDRRSIRFIRNIACNGGTSIPAIVEVTVCP
ncbi:MAG: hypothetical protein IJ856_02665 [Candidatus Methanomethylophilaceae archaeon]|nr:hypothetical protein [Candidatus Methanomethylophilaceae archaeon]